MVKIKLFWEIWLLSKHGSEKINKSVLGGFVSHSNAENMMHHGRVLVHFLFVKWANF